MKMLCSYFRAAAGLAVFSLPLYALTLPVSEDTSTTTKVTVAKSAGKAATLPVTFGRIALMRFDVGAFSGAVRSGNVNQARLVVYFTKVTKPSDLTLHSVASSWSEAFTAPLSVPTIDPTVIATINASDVIAKQFVIIDVTAQVRRWLDAPASDFGFAVQTTTIGNVQIGAKEGSASGYPAQLEIDFDMPAEGSIGTTQLASGGVTMVKIAEAAVASAQLAPNLMLSGTTVGTFSGNLTGDVTGNVSGSATNFTGSLAGDVTGTQEATVIADTIVTGKLLTGFSSAAGTITSSDSLLSGFRKLDENLALKAPLISPSFSGSVLLPAGTVTTAPVRFQAGLTLTTPVFGALEFDGTNLLLTNDSSNPTRKMLAFTDSTVGSSQLAPNLTLAGTTIGTFNGSLTGNVIGSVSGSAASFTEPLSGDVSGTQNATIVSSVGGSSAASVHSAELAANAATSINTAGAIVKRDESGGFFGVFFILAVKLVEA